MRVNHQQEFVRDTTEDPDILRIKTVRSSKFDHDVVRLLRKERAGCDPFFIACSKCLSCSDSVGFENKPVDIYLVSVRWAFDQETGAIKDSALNFLEKILDENKPEIYNEPAI